MLGFLGFAHGGIVGAAGGGPRAQWTMAGEHGRELIKLPPGSQVKSNPDTERMLAGVGGGGRLEVTLRIEPRDSEVARMLAGMLRGHARISYGGSAQAAYGYGAG